ncbi:hypothetical protein JXJ21_13620 [candidate division KSB1 bacterium]|nr:hypothetical protein [candidate division KSB1 bacterium]
MSEMLANQYFMARHYNKAIPLLQKVLDNDPGNINCIKKIIICYAQVGEISRAQEHFMQIMRRDPSIIIDTDPLEDDCPCPGIVQKMEKKTILVQDLATHFTVLGMLYLYCDLPKSISYFELSLEKSPDQPILKEVLRILRAF